MRPQLIDVPFIHLAISSFDFMMVLGILAGLLLARRLSQQAGLDPPTVTKAILYSVIFGLVGARTLFVIHRFDLFRSDTIGVFAVWRGGLEFVGGVVPAAGFLLLYLRRQKLPVRRYMDVMVIGLMVGLAFGRIGCFLNGCCFGKPTALPWGVRFPYRSFAYISQINLEPKTRRPEPYLRLPQTEYFSFYDEDARWYPKPLGELTNQQQYDVTKGRYRCLAVHPSQLYMSGNALLLCAILYIFWSKSTGCVGSGSADRRLGQPGQTFGLMFALYGGTRFLLEFVRDDNPLEFGLLTISQIIGIFMCVLGAVMFVVLLSRKPNRSNARDTAQVTVSAP